MPLALLAALVVVALTLDAGDRPCSSAAAVAAVGAPAGGFAVSLAAISSALLASPEAHPDPRKRWVAALSASGLLVRTELRRVAARRSP